MMGVREPEGWALMYARDRALRARPESYGYGGEDGKQVLGTSRE